MNSQVENLQAPVILVVDDDAVDRERIVRFLRNDFEILEAEDGDIAIKLFEEHDLDCILLDYRLPQSDSVALLIEFVQEHIPVVILTGGGNESVAVEMMKRGAEDYLTKDSLTKDRLTFSINNAVEKSALKRMIRERQRESEAFVAVAAHDLRSPLKNISMIVDQYQREHPTGTHLEACAKIGTQVNRMSDMITDLMKYTRLGRTEIQLEDVDLNQLADELKEYIEAQIIESNADIFFDELPIVRGDKTGLFQLLQNLITNAIKYRDLQRPLKISVTSKPLEQGYQIDIKDNGLGIESEYLTRIFKPLIRAHSTQDGIGLGLSVCEKIVQQHDGKLWVDSEPGTGSTFHFTLSK